MFGSPVIWSIHLIVGYSVSEAACMTNILRFRILGQDALVVTLVAWTLLMMGAIVWNGWWSYRSWRFYQKESPEEEFPLQAYDRDEFLALAGLLLSGIFFFLLLINLYPIVVLTPCV
jgi:hypothetical protein